MEWFPEGSEDRFILLEKVSNKIFTVYFVDMISLTSQYTPTFSTHQIFILEEVLGNECEERLTHNYIAFTITLLLKYDITYLK